MSTSTLTSLDSLNGAPDDERLQDALRSCCTASSWVRRMVAARPYADEADLHAASDAATAELDEAGLAEALAGHPRIGERGPHQPAWSSQEQAGVAGADDPLRAQLAAANAAYELRFDHVYLVCATGRSAAELLDVCRSRLEHDAATERAVVLAELATINRLRLAKLLAGNR